MIVVCIDTDEECEDCPHKEPHEEMLDLNDVTCTSAGYCSGINDMVKCVKVED